MFEDSVGYGQARVFVDSITADLNGDWSLKINSFNVGVEYTAMQDSMGNSSKLSAAFIPNFRPIISTDLSSRTFASQLHGVISRDTLTVFNTGNVDLNLLNFSFTDSTHFSVNGIVGSNTIAPSTSGRLAYQFNPIDPGNKLDTLLIFSNAIDSNPVVIPMAGDAINVAPNGASITNYQFNEDTTNALVNDLKNIYSDANSDSLIFASTVVLGASKFTHLIRNDSLIINTVPDSNGLGQIELTVSDSYGGSHTDTVSITINPVNDLPAIVNLALQDVAIGMEYSTLDTLRVSDSDMEAISFTKIAGAPWLTINSDGTLSGIARNPGNDSLVFSFSDASVSQQSTLYFTVHDVVLSQQTLTDTVVLGDDSRAFNYSVSSTFANPIDYQFTIYNIRVEIHG